MSYRYVTDNNLYDKQDYMYSEYGGKAFLNGYIKTRTEILNRYSCSTIQYNEIKTDEGQCSNTQNNLRKLLKDLREKNYDDMVTKQISGYVKSFEVRKRLYTDYTSEWKPAEKSFEDYDAYLTFADCLLIVYEQNKCLKYYSCLLKLDDTLLSIADRLDCIQQKHLCDIIEKELHIFYKLADDMLLNMEVSA